MVHVLYIDDDIAEHKFFEYFLKNCPEKGVVLTSVKDIETAIECLKTKKIDIAFLDDRFSPFMSCLETLPKLRPYLDNVKLAVISSSIEASHLRSASTLGVEHIFDKAKLKELLANGVSNIFTETSNAETSGKDASDAKSELLHRKAIG